MDSIFGFADDIFDKSYRPSNMSGSSKLEGTGDGLGGGVASRAQEVDLSATVSDLLKTHGVPTKMKSDRFTKINAQVFAAFEAKSNEQKEAVRNVLTYLAIVHGSGPTVRWQDVEASPPGCKKLTMNFIVDMIVTREMFRRYMTNYSDRAVAMHDSSPALQNTLMARAMRNGVPLTDTKSVIDFLDSSTGVDSNSLRLRTMSKYSAVKRANSGAHNSLENAAQAATETMHGYHDDPGSLGSL